MYSWNTYTARLFVRRQIDSACIFAYAHGSIRVSSAERNYHVRFRKGWSQKRLWKRLRPRSKWNQGSTFLEPIKGSRSTHFLRYYGGVATFCPLNSRNIKRSRASERSDQAEPYACLRCGMTLGELSELFLIAVANASMGDAYVTTTP